MRLKPWACQLGRKLGNRAAMEYLPLDRASLHDHTLVSTECVEPRLKEGMDRRRNDDLAVAAVLAHHRQHLLDEERVSLRRGGDAIACPSVEECALEEVLDQRIAFLSLEGLEHE